MKSTRLLPTLGVVLAVVTVAASYLLPRFAPSPVEVTGGVILVLLIALAVLAAVATQRGQGATFVAIAILLPFLVFSAAAYGGAERASAELDSFFDEELGDDFFGDDSGLDEDFLDEDFLDDESLDEGGVYGSDPDLDALYDDCAAGDEQACDDLFLQAPGGSEYESFEQDNDGGF